MAGMFAIDTLARRLRTLVDRSESLKTENAKLLEEALIRGAFERGDAPRITGLPERSARRVLNDDVAAGLLASETPKGSVTLRFPQDTLETLFPRLYPQTRPRHRQRNIRREASKQSGFSSPLPSGRRHPHIL